MRVVSLLPSATEIVFALGRGDQLVGVTFECDYPAAAGDCRVVSTSALQPGLTPREIDEVVTSRMAAGEDLYHLDAGAFSQLQPDIVLTQDLCAVCAVDVTRVEDALDHLGCGASVVTLDPSTLDAVLDSITEVGDALGAAREAAHLVGTLRDRLARLHLGVEGAPTPSVLLLEWTDPPFSAGHWVPDLISAGGGEPVLSDPGGKSHRLSWQAVSAAQVDVVIVAPCGYHLDAAVQLATELVATSRLPGDASVWAVDADSYFVRPGPRLVDGAELVGQILHPELCAPPDPLRARRI